LVKIPVLKISFAAPCGAALWLSHNVLGTYSFNLLQASLFGVACCGRNVSSKACANRVFPAIFLFKYLFILDFKF